LRVFFWTAVAALVGCSTTPRDPDEGVTVVWKRVGDVHAVCQKLAGRKEVFAIHGCTKWTDSDRSGQRVCTIYAQAPENEADTQVFATLGHELLHCFDGSWHDRWGRMTPEESQAAAGGSRK